VTKTDCDDDDESTDRFCGDFDDEPVSELLLIVCIGVVLSLVVALSAAAAVVVPAFEVVTSKFAFVCVIKTIVRARMCGNDGDWTVCR
jgi:hypothetical protein